MEKHYEEKYHELEQKNWWFLGRQDMITLLLKQRGVTSMEKILDIGCAGGALLGVLKREGYDAIGCDLSREAVKLCKKQGLKAKCGDAKNTPFRKKQFDVVIASDILEHVKNDVSALKEWNRVLKDDGVLIVFVPAFNFLWSEHDDVNKHFIRYDKRTLLRSIRKGGFRTVRVSYWNSFLFLPVSLMRLLSRMRGKKKGKVEGTGDLHSLNPVVNWVLLMMLKIENRLFDLGLNSIAGISLMVVVRKRV